MPEFRIMHWPTQHWIYGKYSGYWYKLPALTVKSLKHVMTGKIITILGVALVLFGLAVSYAPWLINWFGRLPGDIRIQNEKSFVFIPIVSMLVVSIVLTLVINLFFRK
jgi:hypothetical protein